MPPPAPATAPRVPPACRSRPRGKRHPCRSDRFLRPVAASGRAARRPARPAGQASAAPMCPPPECASPPRRGSTPAGPGRGCVCLALHASMGASGGASWCWPSARTVRRNMTDTPSSGAGEAGDQASGDKGESPAQPWFPPGSQPGELGQAPPGTGYGPPGTGYGQAGPGRYRLRASTRHGQAGPGQAPGYGQAGPGQAPGYGRPDREPAMAPTRRVGPAPAGPQARRDSVAADRGRRDPRRRVHVHPAQPEGHPRHRRRRADHLRGRHDEPGILL